MHIKTKISFFLSLIYATITLFFYYTTLGTQQITNSIAAIMFLLPIVLFVWSLIQIFNNKDITHATRKHVIQAHSANALVVTLVSIFLALIEPTKPYNGFTETLIALWSSFSLLITYTIYHTTNVYRLIQERKHKKISRKK